MSLSEEYRRQRAWRPWDAIFAALPDLRGATVLDLGCAVGDLAEELTARGARVIGFDGAPELLETARAKGLAGAEFRHADLRSLPDLDAPVDGIWCSFAAAYFIDLRTVLAGWARHLRPGGWIALTEVDDMFGHEPLDPRTACGLEAYARDAFAAGRYDFRMGRKLAGHLRAAGFRLTRSLVLEDRELAFDGPADPAVLTAWRERIGRMTPLRDHFGADFERASDDFLACLARPDHRARAKVYACVAEWPAAAV